MESTEFDQEAARLTTTAKRGFGWIFTILLALLVWQAIKLAYVFRDGESPTTTLATLAGLAISLVLIARRGDATYTLTRTNDSLSKEKARLAKELTEAKAKIEELERLKEEAMPFLIERRATLLLRDRDLIRLLVEREFGSTSPGDTVMPPSNDDPID